MYKEEKKIDMNDGIIEMTAKSRKIEKRPMEKNMQNQKDLN